MNPPALATEGEGEVTTDTISSDECSSVNGLLCIFPFKSGREPCIYRAVIKMGMPGREGVRLYPKKLAHEMKRCPCTQALCS